MLRNIKAAASEILNTLIIPVVEASKMPEIFDCSLRLRPGWIRQLAERGMGPKLMVRRPVRGLMLA